MSEDPILFEKSDGIATLTLNRPKAGNGINMAMARAYMDLAIRCDHDDEIRCVVLTGAGKLFCGGGDIAAFAEAGEGVSAYLSELAGTLHMGVTRFMRMAKPLVTLVNGPAAGAGLGMAIGGDIVLAGRSASFLAAYGGVGLTPDGGMSWLLPRLVGMRRAQEMIIANRKVGAKEAEEIGLVSRVIDDEDLMEEGMRQARLLASSATSAIGGARALLLASYENSLEGQLEREVRSIAAAGGTAECREGVGAFLEKRKPDFTKV
ncbi:2-(1,2-epoxy-1,2-dihydrophenyl)acetyl-CoA isomerase [Novosphingobium marinum]|uniref:2-(1,2-epoxy-1,2-dihydrophenyl)acetyl-CoA isomerase n=1 Tax=Novosphingobium marinum TaxID=1514948 RepID=A0A7Y9XSG5_9SPHN|nr:2-(1,2-epoxy-1,2-dihydrophenyl)acetyl-CoA isomerase [Novosphingobium marinum]